MHLLLFLVHIFVCKCELYTIKFYFAIYVDSLTLFDDRCFPYREVDFLDERLKSQRIYLSYNRVDSTTSVGGGKVNALIRHTLAECVYTLAL